MAQESHRAGLPALWGTVRLFDGFLKIRFEFHMVENTAFIAEANVSLWGICCTEEESVAPPEPVLKETQEHRESDVRPSRETAPEGPVPAH